MKIHYRMPGCITPQFLGKSRQGHRLAKAFLHRELEIFADQRPIDVLL